MPFDSMGRILVVVGLFIAVIGLFFMIGGRVPFLGQLPGDISFERGNSRVYLPIASSILVSVVLTVLINVVGRLFSRS